MVIEGGVWAQAVGTAKSNYNKKIITKKTNEKVNLKK